MVIRHIAKGGLQHRTFPARDPNPFAGKGDNQGIRLPPFPTAGRQPMPEDRGED
jgi:hypothetical protein